MLQLPLHSFIHQKASICLTCCFELIKLINGLVLGRKILYQFICGLKRQKVMLFVPAGDIGDNPVGVTLRRESTLETAPLKQNCRLVKKDEIQIRVYGNSLFCGWAVPIQLYPFKYVLPPACLLVEGYGKVKTKHSRLFFNFGCQVCGGVKLL